MQEYSVLEVGSIVPINTPSVLRRRGDRDNLSRKRNIPLALIANPAPANPSSILGHGSHLASTHSEPGNYGLLFKGRVAYASHQPHTALGLRLTA